MNRVLIIAYRFAPAGGIGSIRASSFASLLPEAGWDVRVIAPAVTPHDVDPSLRVSEEKVTRTRSIELSRLGRALFASAGSGGANANSRSARSVARTVAHRVVYFPDAQIGWYPAAVREGLRLLGRERFDVVYSSSGPMTAHLVAGTLSRRSGMPWVAEFRDPWSEAFPRLPYRRLAARLEHEIAGRASRIIMPNAAMAEHFGQRWGVDVAVVPNGSDLSPDPLAPRPESPVISHVGSYYPGRQNLRVVWQAMAALHRTGHTDVRLRWVGDLPTAARRELSEFGLQEAIDVTGFVAHEEATRLLRSSSVLVASGLIERGPLARGCVPAKLFEYVASGLPVLYVGDAGGEAGRLLAVQPGCHVVAPDDIEGARAALTACLADRVHERDLGSISLRARTAALSEILEAAKVGAWE